MKTTKKQYLNTIKSITLLAALSISSTFVSCNQDVVVTPEVETIDPTEIGSLLAHYSFTDNTYNCGWEDASFYGPDFTHDRTGNEKGALAFNGVTDWIAINDNVLDGIRDEITVSFWTKRGATDGYGVPMCSGNLGKFGFVAKKNSIKGYVVTEDNFTTNNEEDYGTPYILFDQTDWTHIALTYDQSNLRLFINGELIHEQVETGNFKWQDMRQKLLIGNGFKLNQFYKGTLDDIYIYQEALAESAIRGLYKLGN